MDHREAIIGRLWTALNRQDIDAAVALLHPDVDWQDLMAGGRRHGPEAMRAYWTSVFAMIRPTSSTVGCRAVGPDRIAVRTLHSIHDLKGKLWTEEIVTHVFTFRDGLLSGMDVAEPD